MVVMFFHLHVSSVKLLSEYEYLLLQVYTKISQEGFILVLISIYLNQKSLNIILTVVLHKAIKFFFQ
jgi:hypothetical protein